MNAQDRRLFFLPELAEGVPVATPPRGDLRGGRRGDPLQAGRQDGDDAATEWRRRSAGATRLEPPLRTGRHEAKRKGSRVGTSVEVKRRLRGLRILKKKKTP